MWTGIADQGLAGETAAHRMTPARGKLFVRPVNTPETLSHGRIILTPATRNTLVSGQFEVVSLGEPTKCDDPDCERHHWAKHHIHGLTRGDWVLVRHRSLTETHEDNLYCCSQDDVLAVLQP